jgi:hypothetical protein
VTVEAPALPVSDSRQPKSPTTKKSPLAVRSGLVEEDA